LQRFPCGQNTGNETGDAFPFSCLLLAFSFFW
jgi:hypothetical protein